MKAGVATFTKQFERFLDEAHRLKTRYASKILIGLETEFITDPDLI